MSPRALTAILLLLASCASFAAPAVLIVQPLSRDQPELQLSFAQYLAEELDVAGRVAPIVWSMNDPKFREYVSDGTISEFVPAPDLRLIREVGRKLRVQYVMIVDAYLVEGMVIPAADLYRGRAARPVWSLQKEQRRTGGRLVVLENGVVNEAETRRLREQYLEMQGANASTFVVTVDGKIDLLSTAMTLGRTVSRMLSEGPFKGHPPSNRSFTPEPAGSQVFSPDVGDFSKDPPEVQFAIQEALALIKDGKNAEAILVLREAVDADPSSASARRLLTNRLLAAGHFRQAASEAGRGALLASDAADLWLLAARGWILALEPSRARSALNEALARGIDSETSDRISGDLLLLEGELDEAAAAYSRSLERAESVEARLGRALVCALNGDAEQCELDLAVIRGLDIENSELTYRHLITLLSPAVDSLLMSLRDLPLEIRTSNDPATLERAQRAESVATAMVAFLEKVRVPERFSKSHATRNLAHKLIAQCAYDVLTFAQLLDEDVAMESSLSLGEAARLLPTVQELYELELRYGNASDLF